MNTLDKKPYEPNGTTTYDSTITDVRHHPHECTNPDQPAASRALDRHILLRHCHGCRDWSPSLWISLPLHLAGLITVWTAYVVSWLGITVGYHGLIAHRTYDCPNWVKGALLIVWAWALQNSPIKWAPDHLRHHAHCDEEKDPYNAKRGFRYRHYGWLFTLCQYADPKYATRVTIWQHKYYPLLVLAGLARTFLIDFLYNGMLGGVGCFLLAGLGRTFAALNSTFCINSVCQLWGQQPHGTSDSSRDSWLVSLVTFGEGYHPYHHVYPTDYRNGLRWRHFDPSKWLVFGPHSLGLARSLRTGSHIEDSLARTN